jgi:hypothetical protein
MTVRSYFEWALAGLLVPKTLPPHIKDPGDLTKSEWDQYFA